LGNGVRAMLADKGVTSVAAQGFGAPGVVVSYTDDPAIQNGSKFAAEGMQIAAGVPLQCNEPEGFRTFRLGLFGDWDGADCGWDGADGGVPTAVWESAKGITTILVSQFPFSGQCSRGLPTLGRQHCHAGDVPGVVGLP